MTRVKIAQGTAVRNGDFMLPRRVQRQVDSRPQKIGAKIDIAHMAKLQLYPYRNFCKKSCLYRYIKSKKIDRGKRRRTKGLRHLSIFKNPTSTGGYLIFKNGKTAAAPFSVFLQPFPQCIFAKKARFPQIPVLQKYNGGKAV